MLSLMPLPANFVTSTLTYSGLLFDDFKILFFLAIGILIGLGIFSKIVRKGKDYEEDENVDDE